MKGRLAEADASLNKRSPGHKLMNLVADGVTDPSQLRQLTLESLLLPGD